MFRIETRADRLVVMLTGQAHGNEMDITRWRWQGREWPAMQSTASVERPARIGGRQVLGSCYFHSALNCMVNQTAFTGSLQHHLRHVLARNKYRRGDETLAQVNKRRFGHLDVSGLGISLVSPQGIHTGRQGPSQSGRLASCWQGSVSARTCSSGSERRCSSSQSRTHCTPP